MNPTHVHLMITHLPIFASALGLLVLIYGIWQQSTSTKIAAYGLFVIGSIGAGIAYLTGEEAEETVEHLAGIARSTIHTHEEAAMYALVSMIFLGLASIVGIYSIWKSMPAENKISNVMILLAIVCFSIVARVGYLGGQIRHSEVNPNNIELQKIDTDDESDKENK